MSDYPRRPEPPPDEEREERAAAHKRALDSIPPEFSWVQPGAPSVLALPWAKSFQPGSLLEHRRLTLHGQTGAGKTTMAILILLHVVDRAQPGAPPPDIRRARGARFVSAADLCPLQESGRAARLREAQDATFLVLDDVGRDDGLRAGWETEKRIAALKDLLEVRYRHSRQTVLTSAIDRRAFADLYDGGTERRWFDPSTPGTHVLELRRGR